MNKFTFSLLFVCMLFACGEKEKQVTIPPHILSKEKMAQVIADIHIAEAETNLRTLPDSTPKEPINFRMIYEKDSVTKQQYEESLSFYIDHPELLDSVYVEVLNEISRLQAEKQ